MSAGKSNASNAVRRLPNREAALDSLYNDISASSPAGRPQSTRAQPVRWRSAQAERPEPGRMIESV